MPKKKKQAPKQANIKEMFVNKRRAEMDVADDNEDYKRIKISPYLLNSNDITQETDYPVSIMAKVYFREHSNINEVLDRYLEREKLTNVDKDTFLSIIIRHAISYKRFKRDYPFNLFAFESDYHECIGKFLLKHYEIKTNENLRDANIFLSQENLMHCQISMDFNNKFRSDEQEYINRKREKVGYQHVKPFLRIGTDHALRKYKEEHNLLEKYHIKDMSLEDMCRVTNIEYLTKIEMDKKKVPKSFYDECLEGAFEAFKKNPSIAITNEKFYVFPHYLFIINDLTPKQEFLVTERKDRFYAYTNAKDLLAIYKKYIHLPNESTDPVVNTEERQRLFYLKYIRMIDKKQAPFNYLLWTKDDNSDPESNPNENRVECENQPGPSSVTSNFWKKKQVAEKNDFVLPSQVNPPNNNDQFNKENTLIGHRLARNPMDYIKFQQYNSKYAELIKFLLKEKEFIDELKKEIIKDSLCAKMWDKNNHLILWNCLNFNFEDRNEFFLNLLMNCQISDRAKLIEMLKNADIDLNGTESIDPIPTSTQTIEIPFIQESTPKSSKNQQKRPFQCSNNSDDILVMNNKTPKLQLSTNIKQEPISEQFVENSDVQIVPVDVTDVVSISDEEDVITGKNRVMPEKKAMDVYQQNLNMESQANNETNDDHENLEAEYGLVVNGESSTNGDHGTQKEVPADEIKEVKNGTNDDAEVQKVEDASTDGKAENGEKQSEDVAVPKKRWYQWFGRRSQRKSKTAEVAPASDDNKAPLAEQEEAKTPGNEEIEIDKTETLPANAELINKEQNESASVESPNSAPEKRKRLTLNFFRRSTKKNKKEVKQEEEEEKISPTETIVEEIEIRMTDSKDESPQNSEPEELVVENIEEKPKNDDKKDETIAVTEIESPKDNKSEPPEAVVADDEDDSKRKRFTIRNFFRRSSKKNEKSMEIVEKDEKVTEPNENGQEKEKTEENVKIENENIKEVPVEVHPVIMTPTDDEKEVVNDEKLPIEDVEVSQAEKFEIAIGDNANVGDVQIVDEPKNDDLPIDGNAEKSTNLNDDVPMKEIEK